MVSSTYNAIARQASSFAFFSPVSESTASFFFVSITRLENAIFLSLYCLSLSLSPSTSYPFDIHVDRLLGATMDI